MDKLKGTPLSNMWVCKKKISFCGLLFATSEQLYFALCYREVIEPSVWANMANGYEAKAYKKTLVSNGLTPQNTMNSMRRALEAKFWHPTPEQGFLLRTGEEELVEGNYWHDNFWGACTCIKCKDIPKQNHLGKLLMEQRKWLTHKAVPDTTASG